MGGWGSQMLSCVDGGVVVIVMFDAGADRVCARQPLQMAVVHDARRGILGVLGVLDGSQSLGQIVYKGFGRLFLVGKWG